MSKLPARPVTIVDIAEEAGVSFKSVARVINNEPGVGAATRARIQALLERHNYKPNVAARSLPGARSYLIGLLFDTLLPHYYYNEVQIGAMRACRRNGYHLIVEETHELVEQGRKALLDGLASSRLDGVILPVPAGDDSTILSVLEELNVPYVRITPSTDMNRSAFVGMDDRRAAYEMTEYLWGLGHRDIAFVGHEEHPASQWRYEGYRDFMREKEIDPTDTWALVNIYDSHASVRATEIVLKRTPRPTAIFSATDYIAFGVLNGAVRGGLKVPEQLSVAGFDDSPGAESVWPPLTTINQPIAGMTEAAVDILVGRIGNKAGEQISRLLDFELIKRASTAPPSR